MSFYLTCKLVRAIFGTSNIFLKHKHFFSTVTEDKVEEKNGEEDIENQNVPSTSVDAREREDEEEGQDPDLPTPGDHFFINHYDFILFFYCRISDLTLNVTNYFEGNLHIIHFFQLFYLLLKINYCQFSKYMVVVVIVHK